MLAVAVAAAAISDSLELEQTFCLFVQDISPSRLYRTKFELLVEKVLANKEERGEFASLTCLLTSNIASCFLPN